MEDEHSPDWLVLLGVFSHWGVGWCPAFLSRETVPGGIPSGRVCSQMEGSLAEWLGFNNSWFCLQYRRPSSVAVLLLYPQVWIAPRQQKLLSSSSFETHSHAFFLEDTGREAMFFLLNFKFFLLLSDAEGYRN